MPGIRSYSMVLILLVSLVQLQGQELITDPSIRHKQYDFIVAQFDDFAERFNKPVADSTLSRAAAIASLFNHDDSRIDRDSKGYSPEYEVLVKEFIQAICHDSLLIDKNSEAVFASAKAMGKYNGERTMFHIILRQEKVGEDMLKWVIWDIEAAFLEFLKEDSTYLRFLPPSSGELDFKELIRAMNDLDYLQYYAFESYLYDPLSVFFYLLHEGKLEIESIQEVKYRIYDIPGWCMVLKDFKRVSENAGWLIENLYKAELPVKCQ